MTDAGDEGSRAEARVNHPRGTAKRGRLYRGFRRVVGVVVGHERVLVTLMAVMVCLSAFAVWQATRASDEADDVAAQIRVTDAQQQVWESQLQTTLSYNLQVISRYCASFIEYNAGLYQLLSGRPNAADVIPAQLDLETLGPLSLGGVPAGACDPDSASGGAAAHRFEIARVEAALPSPPGDTQRLVAAAQDFRRQELRLMGAGLLFALALFGLIGIDVLSDRAHRPRRLSGRRVRLGQATAFLVAATAFLVGIGITAVYAKSLYFAILLIGLAALAAWRVHSRRSGAIAARSRLDVSHPQWWAEVVGALTLVAFSATALGLSTVSGHERLDRAESEAQRTASSALSEQGQLAAMRDLFAVAELAEADAAIAAADLRNDDALGLAAAERRDARESFLRDLEESIRDQLAIRGTSTSSRGCPTRAAELDTDPRVLMDQIRDTPASAGWHIYDLQEGALACNVVADERGASAARWSSRKSALTVSLVLLGLAGFLLALAADPGRSAGMANWLLRAGAAGAAVGVLVAASIPIGTLWEPDRLDADDLLSFARDVASGQTNGCDVAAFDTVIKRSADYGPAYAGRAQARACEKNAIPVAGVLTSDLDEEAVDEFRDDFTRAAELGPQTPGAVGNAGWANILSGLHGGDGAVDLLEEGLRQTKQAVSQSESGSGAAGRDVHVFRFNEALAQAALGEVGTAEATYRKSVTCLDPDAGCPGGGLVEPARRTEMVLWALADLELLADTPAADRLKTVVIGTLASSGTTPSAWEGAELDLFPQEVQISGGRGTPPEVSVVWYFRPDDDSSWGVIEGASEQTLLPGDHLDHTITADMALPAGAYRADVYMGGERVSSLEAEREVALVTVRETVPDLGVAVVVPPEWAVTRHFAGTLWSMAPPDSAGASFHREEGVELEGIASEYMEAALDRWLQETFGRATSAAPHTTGLEYFAGLEEPLVRRYRDFPLTAAIGFSPYATNIWCGGGLIMAAVGGTEAGVDSDVVDEVFDSITLSGDTPHLPDLGGHYEAEEFALNIPEGWDAAERPVGATGNAFQARDCSANSNILVSLEDRNGYSVDEIVRQTLGDYAVATDFPEFELLSRKNVEVAGSSVAEELVFTWTHPVNGAVRQRQTYAARGDRILYMTFTEPNGNRPLPLASRQFARSLELRG